MVGEIRGSRGGNHREDCPPSRGLAEANVRPISSPYKTDIEYSRWLKREPT